MEKSEEMQKNKEKIIDPEMIEALDKLKDYLNQGFLLHGSKTKLDVIEPRQANDDDPERKVGKLHAVYAAKAFRVPIMMALFAQKDKNLKSWTSSYNQGGRDKDLVVSGKNVTFTPGFVHVLPSETFETVRDDTGSSELVSRVPVKVIDQILVKPSIVDLLPNVKIEFEY